MNNKIIKNASWIIGCRIVQAMLNLLVSMITARYLGLSNYGIITYAQSIVAFVVPIVQLGLNGILVQQFVEYPNESGEIIGTVTILTTFSSFLGIVGIWVFSTIVNPNESKTIIVTVIYSISMFFQMTEMIQYWYQAKLLSKYVSVSSLVSRFIVSIYKIYIIITGKSIYWFAIVNSIDFLIISVCLYMIYYKLEGMRLYFSFQTAKRMLSKSKHFIISGLMVSVFAQIDKIMLKIMIGDEEVGLYSAAVTCAGMTVFIFTAIADSLRPVIFENKKTNAELYRMNIVRLYSVTIYLALCQSIVLTIFAEPIVRLLYGVEYLASTRVLRVITWYSMFSYLGSAQITWFLAEEKQQYVWLMNLIGAIFNIIANWILIPSLGAVGAAVASLATQFLTNFLLCLILKPLRENGFMVLEAINPRGILDSIKHKL